MEREERVWREERRREGLERMEGSLRWDHDWRMDCADVGREVGVGEEGGWLGGSQSSRKKT